MTVTDYRGTGGHNYPAKDATQDLTLLGYDTDGSSYVTAKWKRKLNTGDTVGKDAVLALGQSSVFSYASRKGSKVLA